MSNNFFEVLRAGINTTYQDKGRFHMQHFGVAPGGCMDFKSFLIANALIGNNSEDGVLDSPNSVEDFQIITTSIKALKKLKHYMQMAFFRIILIF